MWLLQQLSRRPSPHVILQHVVFLCRGAVARCLRCSQETLGLELGGGQGQAGQEGGEVGPGDVLSAQPRDDLVQGSSREVPPLLPGHAWPGAGRGPRAGWAGGGRGGARRCAVRPAQRCPFQDQPRGLGTSVCFRRDLLCSRRDLLCLSSLLLALLQAPGALKQA